jgi:hypothetical protein
MKKAFLLLLCSLSGCAGMTFSPSTVDTAGLIYKVNEYGERQPHKGMYRIVGDRIYETDSLGAIQYHKPALQLK